MRYEELPADRITVTVVYGGTPEERDAFQRVFLQGHPEFRAQTHPSLASYKKPLFGQKSVEDYLVRQARRGERSLNEQQLRHLIKTGAQGLGVDHLLGRFVPSLSGYQKFRFSLILDKCTKNRRCVLVRDEEGLPSGPGNLGKGQDLYLAQWFSQEGGCGGTGSGAGGYLVVLAEDIDEQLVDYVRIAQQAPSRIGLFELKDGELATVDVPLLVDMQNILDEAERKRRAEEERQRERRERYERARRELDAAVRICEDMQEKDEQKHPEQVSGTRARVRELMQKLDHEGSLSHEERQYVIDHAEDLTVTEIQAFDRYMTHLHDGR